MNRELWDDRLRTIFGLSMLDHPARLQDGIQAAMKELGVVDESALLARIDRGDPDAKLALARALTVGETYFFREPTQLEHFRDTLLPAAAKNGVFPIVVVSAGCSSGEEAYTLAILAREKLGDEATEKVRVIGFDLNSRSIESARRGVYRPWSLRGVAESVKERWFDAVPDGASVKAAVRAMVRFEQRNMVDPRDALEPASADVVFCRNTLIYFDDASAKLVLAQLARGLRTGGNLIVGSAEAAFFAIAELGAHAVGETWMHSQAERFRAVSPVTRPPISPHRPAARRVRTKPNSDRKPIVVASSSPPAAHDVLELLDRGWKALATDPLRAGEEARRAILLDRTMVAAHVLAASAAFALRDIAAARSALRHARRYLVNAPAASLVHGGGGATAAELTSYCLRLEKALE